MLVALTASYVELVEIAEEEPREVEVVDGVSNSQSRMSKRCANGPIDHVNEPIVNRPNSGFAAISFARR